MWKELNIPFGALLMLLGGLSLTNIVAHFMVPGILGPALAYRPRNRADTSTSSTARRGGERSS